MEDAAVFFLRFDTISGPVIEKKVGNVEFDSTELVSLKACAFPDTAVQSPSESTIFAYKIGKYYCYSIFTSTPDPMTPRGHRQVSYVIATQMPYVYPFTRILHSSMLMSDIEQDTMILLISDFVTKAMALFTGDLGENNEIPTFDGGLPVTAAKDSAQLLDLIGGIGWTPQCKKYLLNDNFLGMDLISSLSIQHLVADGRTIDVLKLWEAAVLSESVMILGATPTIASSAAFAVASLTYPEPLPENVLPFVAATDPRFQVITSSHFKGLIVGFSNPIALQRCGSFDVVMSTGFGLGQDGLKTPKGNWKDFHRTNSELRRIFYLNNCKLREAVTSCLAELSGTNPYAAYVGEVDSDSLAKHLAVQDITMSISTKAFAQKLLRAQLFTRVWKERMTQQTLLAALKSFSMDNFCTGRIEHELIDLYSMVQRVRKLCAGNREIEKIIDTDLTTITLYLSPDLILAPSDQDM